MVKRRRGRIVWVSSREGLNVNPFTGIYAASKHAVEAVAETMSMELQEFGIEVATVNPGPILTGFNDRGFETWKSWEDDPYERLFDYSKQAFPRAQFDPEPASKFTGVDSVAPITLRIAFSVPVNPFCVRSPGSSARCNGNMEL